MHITWMEADLQRFTLMEDSLIFLRTDQGNGPAETRCILKIYLKKR